MKKPTIALAVVVIAVVAAIALAQSDKQPQTKTSSKAAGAVMITYDGNSFEPNSIKIAAGSQITVKNNSAQTIDFASGPHPAHTGNSELNIGSLAPGQKRSFSVQRTGTWPYHNHLNETQGGTIVVQ